MGSGVSIDALPERLDEEMCKELAGDLYDEGTFSLEKDDDGCVAREQFLDFVKKLQNLEPEPEVYVKTAEEESDDEFEAELQSLDRKTYKVNVHMYSRNMETGRLGGERGNSGTTRTPSAATTLLPPSTMRSGKSHRLQPVPMTFTINCGKTATFKWLGLVAAQRYARETALIGERRHREQNGTSQSGSFMLPSYISSSEDNDSFHNPSDLIFGGSKPLKDGVHLWVTLDDQIPLDDITVAPNSTRWSTLAFMNKRKNVQDEAIKTEQELAIDRSERHRIRAEQEQEARTRHKIDAMHRVLGDSAHRSDAEAKLTMHYLTLCGDTMSLYDDEEDVVMTLECLQSNYTSLSEVFKNFATSKKGKFLCMTSNDFTKFAMESKVLPPEQNWKILDIYKDSLIKEAGIKNRSGKHKSATAKLMVSPDLPVITTSMDMAGFLVSIRNLAFSRFLEPAEGRMSNEQIKEVGRFKIKNVRDAVQVSLNTSILLLLDKSLMMSLVRRALGIEEVLCLYFDHLSKLRQVFEKYAGADGVADTMTLTEFSAMIRDAGIMSMTEAKKVFVLVQQGENEAEEDVYDDDNLMTFAEFLSGIARIGMWKYHLAGGSLAVKISKAVEVVCSLWNPEMDAVDYSGDHADTVSDVTNSIMM